MTDLNGMTEETLEAVKKAQTAGVVVATGIAGIDLSGLVSLVPVNTPWLDRLAAETAPQGAAVAQWKALTNINAAQPNPFVGLEGGGNFVQVSQQPVFSAYQPIRLSGKVTKDEIALAKGYADAKAVATVQTLMQYRIMRNKAHLGGQAFALPAITTPTLTTSTTGGGIAATTAVYVKVQARSPYNYYWGGSGICSATANITTGAGTTNTVTAKVPAVRGAVAYDWFVGTSGSQYYVTTTTVNTATFTAVPGAAAAAVPNIPDLYTTVPSANASDLSFNPNAINGLIATLAGDYGTNAIVTPGSGIGSGCVFTSLDGATLTGTSQGVNEIDQMLLNIYNNSQLSPTALIMNGQEATNIANRVLATNAAVTYLNPNAQGRVGATAGGSIGQYANKAAGGALVELVVDPHYPVGSITAITETIPYPEAGISRTFARRMLVDTTQTPYGTGLTPGGAGSGPREEWDVSSLETFVNRAPVACGVISNIQNG